MKTALGAVNMCTPSSEFCSFAGDHILVPMVRLSLQCSARSCFQTSLPASEEPFSPGASSCALPTPTPPFQQLDIWAPQ